MNQVVPVEKCVPNTWNYNEMSDEMFNKLCHGILDLVADPEQKMPPIIVRTHPLEAGKFEIIDGEHRWKAFQELRLKDIPIFVVEADDEKARVLTSTLNYTRGTPNIDKQAAYLRALADMSALGLDQLAVYLPQSKSELQVIADAYNVAFKPVKVKETIEETRDLDREKLKDSTFVTIEFPVSVSQAEVIEKEVKRIAGMLEGRNLRGRALEYIAVNSMLTPDEDVGGNMEAHESLKHERSLQPKRKFAKIRVVKKAGT